MSNDFYCDQVLNGKTPVNKVIETENVLAYYHTRPFYEVHIVAIPKKHILSFVDVSDEDTPILHELLSIIRKVAAQVTEEYGACKIMTNLGEYQESKHLHWHIVYGERIRD
ncbi:histidine triad (HIT) family protein [Mesobacillus persicus]|uniref:Histidine triad (HIT) family protein n=1 Tax=Mesobacillus persicus TaxID=930146 RepID=A0A1H8IQ31_9BACI|nr:HIT domain-containing protein [Mesobacillus persicus]SEN71010.1 histidine triad (HIT) family protein [Mesobacillus persicus]